MNKLENEQAVVEAMAASIANHEKYSQSDNRNRGLLYMVKYLIWNVLLAVLSPQLAVTSKRMVCATTQLSEKQLIAYAEHGEYVRLSKLNASIRQMRINRSVLSPYGQIQRFKLLVKGILFYLRYHTSLEGYPHFTIEYYTIAWYLQDQHPEEIVSPNTYERYSTLLSYLGHSMGIRLIGVQDGALIDIDVPAKLYCDEMHVFDAFEADMFRHCIQSEHCQYIQEGFQSTLKWTDYPPKSDKRLIGIASQDWLTEKTLVLVERLLTALDPDHFEIVIYPHYRETMEQYAEIQKKFPGCKIETQVRHRNIDVLITYYSTIVYDFWSVNPELPIVCLKIPGYEPSYYQRDNVNIYYSIEDIIVRLNVQS